MMTVIIVLGLLTLINVCVQIHTIRRVRTLHQRMDAATTARQAFREGGRLLRERLDKRFGVRL